MANPVVKNKRVKDAGGHTVLQASQAKLTAPAPRRIGRQVRPRQVGDLARVLGLASARDIRYFLEEQFASPDIPNPLPNDQRSPSRGNHRILDGGVQFWLAIAVRLKQLGMRGPMAMRLAEYSKLALGELAQGMKWDRGFQPFDGQFDTDQDWIVELGDSYFVRIATSAFPGWDVSRRGLYRTEWAQLSNPRIPCPGVACATVLQINLSTFAAILRGAEKVTRRAYY